jgi:hypothetical protein
MCNRRIANQLLLRVKIQALRRYRLGDTVERLVRNIQCSMRARAARRFGGLADDIATVAPLILQSQVNRCLVYVVSAPEEDTALTTAYRDRTNYWRALLEAVGGEQPQPSGQVDSGRPLLPTFWLQGWPAWLIAMGYLVCLSRRSWAYAAILTARGTTPDWLADLARVVVGSAAAPSLTRSTHALEGAAAELQQVYDALLQWRQARDPVEQLVARLAEKFKDRPEGDNLWGEVAAEVRAALVAGPVASKRYAVLSRCLSKMAVQLRPPCRADALPSALADLCRETNLAALPVRGDSAPAALISWLLDLPSPLLSGERKVADVLADLRLAPANAPDAPPPVADLLLTRQQLVDGLRAGFGPGSPHQLLLAGLILGDTWDAILGRLSGSLPALNRLPSKLLEEAGDRLAAWQSHLVCRGTPTLSTDPWDDCLTEEMPSAVFRIPTEVPEAIELLEHWEFARAWPERWADVPSPGRHALEGVLGSLYLDDLLERLQSFYRQRRSC